MRKKHQVQESDYDVSRAAYFRNREHPEFIQLGDNTVVNPRWSGYHLYFTSYEKPQPEDWCLGNQGTVLKVPKSWIVSGDWSKIVATTNPKLWKRILLDYDSSEEGSERFKDGIAKIGLDFVKRYVEERGNIKEVDLEMEHEMKPPGYYDSMSSPILKFRSDGTVVIHPVKEKTYTRKELIEACYDFRLFVSGNSSSPITPHSHKEWFDKNYPE